MADISLGALTFDIVIRNLKEVEDQLRSLTGSSGTVGTINVGSGGNGNGGTRVSAGANAAQYGPVAAPSRSNGGPIYGQGGIRISPGANDAHGGVGSSGGHADYVERNINLRQGATRANQANSAFDRVGLVQQRQQEGFDAYLDNLRSSPNPVMGTQGVYPVRPPSPGRMSNFLSGRQTPLGYFGALGAGYFAYRGIQSLAGTADIFNQQMIASRFGGAADQLGAADAEGNKSVGNFGWQMASLVSSRAGEHTMAYATARARQGLEMTAVGAGDIEARAARTRQIADAGASNVSAGTVGEFNRRRAAADEQYVNVINAHNEQMKKIVAMRSKASSPAEYKAAKLAFDVESKTYPSMLGNAGAARGTAYAFAGEEEMGAIGMRQMTTGSSVAARRGFSLNAANAATYAQFHYMNGQFGFGPNAVGAGNPQYAGMMSAMNAQLGGNMVDETGANFGARGALIASRFGGSYERTRVGIAARFGASTVGMLPGSAGFNRAAQYSQAELNDVNRQEGYESRDINDTFAFDRKKYGQLLSNQYSFGTGKSLAAITGITETAQRYDKYLQREFGSGAGSLISQNHDRTAQQLRLFQKEYLFSFTPSTRDARTLDLGNSLQNENVTKVLEEIRQELIIIGRNTGQNATPLTAP